MSPLRLWPLALLLACAPSTRPSTAPAARVHAPPPAPPRSPPPAPLDSDGDGVFDPADQCPDEHEVKNNHRDGDGCPDEQAFGYGYFMMGLRPVRFTATPAPRRGAPAHTSVYLSTDDQATEVYDFVPPDRFLTVADAPRATIAAPSNFAAYPQLRRFLAHGAVPPLGSLHIESMLDYFADATVWSGDAALMTGSEVGPCPWAPDHRLVRVRVQALPAPPPPRLFVLLVDISPSMGAPERLPLLKQAMPTLLSALGPHDRLAILGFANKTELILPPTASSERTQLDAAITRLRPLGGAVRHGQTVPDLDLLRAHQRRGESLHVLLATDGVGMTPVPPVPLPLHTTLSVLELGRGDLEDAALAHIAEDHDGHLYHLDTAAEARRTFTALARQGSLVAGDLQLQAKFSPQQVTAYRQVGHANNQISPREFSTNARTDERVHNGTTLGRRRAGDLHAGQGITLLYEIVPTTSTTDPLQIDLRYRAQGRDRRTSHTVHDRGLTDLAATSDDFRFSAAVATLGLLVHGGPRGAASLELAHNLASGALGPDPTGERRDFLTLLARAAGPLAPRLAQWATEDAWLRAHPSTIEIPPSSIPLLTFESMRMLIGDYPIALIGHHDGHEGRSPAERDAIALARATAVHRYLVEVMHHPPARYHARLPGPDDNYASHGRRMVTAEIVIP